MAAKSAQAITLTDVMRVVEEILATQKSVVTQVGALSTASANLAKDVAALVQAVNDPKKPARAPSKKAADAAAGTASTSAAAAAPAPVIIKTIENFFTDKYMKDPTYAAKFASVATTVRDRKDYVNAKDKAKKEAVLVYDSIKKQVPYEADMVAIKKEFDAMRAANTEKRGLQTPVGTSPSTAAVAEAKASAAAADAAPVPAAVPAASAVVVKKRTTKKDASASAAPAPVPTAMTESVIGKAAYDDSITSLDDDE